MLTRATAPKATGDIALTVRRDARNFSAGHGSLKVREWWLEIAAHVTPAGWAGVMQQADREGDRGRPAAEHGYAWVVRRRCLLRASLMPPVTTSSSPAPMGASHSIGEPEPCGEVPPKHVSTPSAGG